MNHKYFFEKHGELVLGNIRDRDGRKWGDPCDYDLLFELAREVTIEDLYQAFKARIAEELKEKGEPC